MSILSDGLYDWVTRGTNAGFKAGVGVGPVSLDAAAGLAHFLILFWTCWLLVPLIKPFLILIKQKFCRIWNWSGKPWGRRRACKQSRRRDPGGHLSKFINHYHYYHIRKSFSLTFVSFLKVVWLTDDEWETQEWWPRGLELILDSVNPVVTFPANICPILWILHNVLPCLSINPFFLDIANRVWFDFIGGPLNLIPTGCFLIGSTQKWQIAKELF